MRIRLRFSGGEEEVPCVSRGSLWGSDGLVHQFNEVHRAIVPRAHPATLQRILLPQRLSYFRGNLALGSASCTDEYGCKQAPTQPTMGVAPSRRVSETQRQASRLALYEMGLSCQVVERLFPNKVLNLLISNGYHNQYALEAASPAMLRSIKLAPVCIDLISAAQSREFSVVVCTMSIWAFPAAVDTPLRTALGAQGTWPHLHACVTYVSPPLRVHELFDGLSRILSKCPFNLPCAGAACLLPAGAAAPAAANAGMRTCLCKACTVDIGRGP